MPSLTLCKIWNSVKANKNINMGENSCMGDTCILYYECVNIEKNIGESLCCAQKA